MRVADTQNSAQLSDPRFTLSLLADVRHVLKQHGYVESQDPGAHAGFLAGLLELTAVFEGPK